MPDSTLGWGGLAFIVLVLTARAAYWITDRKGKHR